MIVCVISNGVNGGLILVDIIISFWVVVLKLLKIMVIVDVVIVLVEFGVFVIRLVVGELDFDILKVIVEVKG